MNIAWTTLVLLFLVAGTAFASPADYFKLSVVDNETGRGIPLVRVTTKNHIEYYTDSAGVVAVGEPELFGKKVYFSVWSHGYDHPKDGFGAAGKAFVVEPGGGGEIGMNRINLAQRLYRITGAGQYAHSVLVGDSPPTDHPLGCNTITGSDSVITTLYKGGLFWVWGDTGSFSHPISGNYKVTAATSELPGTGGLDPEVGVNLHYFTKGDFVKEMANVETGPCWFGNLHVYKDRSNKEHLMSTYAIVDKAMKATERGWAEFDESQQIFNRFHLIPLDNPMHPRGHCFTFEDEGTDYVYFFGHVLTRIRDSYEAITDVSAYESFTCLKEGINLQTDSPEVTRDEQGRLLYGWRKMTSPTGKEDLNNLVKEGLIEPKERWIQLTDIDTGDEIQCHGLNVNWNEYRQRWVMIYSQFFGSSLLGEIWYAEADSPLGPWTYTKKIMTHDTYSFYNPIQHPYFSKRGGRHLFFEGTYTEGFSGNKYPTPRYDYNQIMYKLELDSPKLRLPVAVYITDDPQYDYLTHDRIPSNITGKKAVFYAPNLPREGTVPIYRTYSSTNQKVTLSTENTPGSAIAFYAVPADASETPPSTKPVTTESLSNSGNYLYVLGELEESTEQEAPEVLFYVWEKPSDFNPFDL